VEHSIEMILENEEGAQVDDVTLVKILHISHQRYAVLQLPDGITFSKIILDDEGIPGLNDITDEAEFKYVESVYRASI
jgi:hypothetical protein